MMVTNCSGTGGPNALPNTDDNRNKVMHDTVLGNSDESQLTTSTAPSSSSLTSSSTVEADCEDEEDETSSHLSSSSSESFELQQPLGFAELDSLVESLEGTATPLSSRMSKPHQRQRSRRSFSFSSSPLSTIHEDDLLASTSSASSSPHSLSFSGVMPIGRLDEYELPSRTRAYTSPPRLARSEQEEDEDGEERRDDEDGLATSEHEIAVVDSNRCDSESSPTRNRRSVHSDATPKTSYTTLNGVVFDATSSKENNDENGVPPPPTHPLHRSGSDKPAPESISPRRIDDDVVFLTNGIKSSSSRQLNDRRRKQMRIPQLPASAVPPPPLDSPRSEDGKPVFEPGSPLSRTTTNSSNGDNANWLPSAMSLLALAHDSDDDDWNDSATSTAFCDPWKKDEADPVILLPSTPDPRRGKMKKGHRRQRSMDWSLPLESSSALSTGSSSASSFVVQNCMST